MDPVEEQLTDRMTAAQMPIDMIGAAIQMWMEFRIALGEETLNIPKPETWAAALDYTVRKVNLRDVPMDKLAYVLQSLSGYCTQTQRDPRQDARRDAVRLPLLHRRPESARQARRSGRTAGNAGEPLQRRLKHIHFHINDARGPKKPPLSIQSTEKSSSSPVPLLLTPCCLLPNEALCTSPIATKNGRSTAISPSIQMLKYVKVLPENVLVVRNGQLIPEDQKLHPGDEVKIVAVVSGG